MPKPKVRATSTSAFLPIDKLGREGKQILDRSRVSSGLPIGVMRQQVSGTRFPDRTIWDPPPRSKKRPRHKRERPPWPGHGGLSGWCFGLSGAPAQEGPRQSRPGSRQVTGSLSSRRSWRQSGVLNRGCHSTLEAISIRACPAQIAPSGVVKTAWLSHSSQREGNSAGVWGRSVIH